MIEDMPNPILGFSCHACKVFDPVGADYAYAYPRPDEANFFSIAWNRYFVDKNNKTQWDTQYYLGHWRPVDSDELYFEVET